MVKKQHIARHIEYTATHMGDKTLKSQRMRNHETANRNFTESEDIHLWHRRYIQVSNTSYYTRLIKTNAYGQVASRLACESRGPEFDTSAGNNEKACKKPATICADTHGQLGTRMLGVRVTWMQFTGFKAYARLVKRLIPCPLPGLRVLHLPLAYTQAERWPGPCEVY